MEIVWIIVGLIYIVLALLYFYLAYKSSKKHKLDDIQLEELSTEPYEPKKNVGFYIGTTITNEKVESEFRSKVFVDIIEHFNKQIIKFQNYINKNTLPKLQEYIDSTSKVNITGYIIAGSLSLIAAAIAFLAASRVL